MMFFDETHVGSIKNIRAELQDAVQTALSKQRVKDSYSSVYIEHKIEFEKD
jgi:hypothetical protein